MEPTARLGARAGCRVCAWPTEESSAGGSVETVRSEGKEGIEVIGAAFKVIAGEPGPREDRKSPEIQPSQELELEEPTSDTLAASQCLPSKDKPLNSLTRDGALGWYLSVVACAC